MSVRIWHDDVRPAPEGWCWCKTNAAAMHMLTEYGEAVSEISLDHDLGAVPTGDMDPTEVLYLRGTAEETGLDLVRWMVEFDRVPPRVTIHSWNPAGADRMFATLVGAGYGPVVTKRPYEIP